MDRTPRNAGQSFSIAAAESVVVATVEVIIVVIMVGTGFPGVQAVSHIASVWLLVIATVWARLQLVVLRSSHVACVKINRNSTVPEVSGTSFASYSWGGYSLKYRKIPKISPSMYKPPPNISPPNRQRKKPSVKWPLQI